MNSKAASERYQRQVLEISKQPGNETCADCRGRYPRWASWNLGIFLCVNCAGVHRKMGTHISKIKSLTLDTWTKEQVEKMREGGNVKNSLKFNPDERRNRPPANIDEGERNSELERFIFDKYKGRFMDKSPPPVPSKDLPYLRAPSGGYEEHSSRIQVTEGLDDFMNKEALPRSRTAPIPSSWAEAKRAASVSPAPQFQQNRQATVAPTSLPAKTSETNASTLNPPSNFPARSSSAIPPSSSLAATQPAAASTSSSIAISTAPTANSSVFDDLLSISSNTLNVQQSPLQMQQHTSAYQHTHLGNPWASLATHQQALISPMMMMSNNSASSSYFQQTPQLSHSLPPPSQQQQSYLSHGGDQTRGATLGNMAFPNNTTSPFTSSQATGNPFHGTNGAQFMGQQAFEQYQQSIPIPAPNLGLQPTGQPPPFGTFANSMMPTAQQSQTYSTPWQQQQQNQNMWS